MNMMKDSYPKWLLSGNKSLFFVPPNAFLISDKKVIHKQNYPFYQESSFKPL
jgi:hypothetical protein